MDVVYCIKTRNHQKTLWKTQKTTTYSKPIEY